MASPLTPLPIDHALPPLRLALAAHSSAMLVAPPGAGKTTRAPLALLDEPWVKGKRLILLEPRRIAARAAAARMAATLGEKVGEAIGLRVRLQSLVSKRTRIEVVTEGVFTRMVLDDPSLDGVAGVLFDEFHERSLDADLGLAFALDAQQGLREDLRLLVMSATLDGARVRALLGDAPLIESKGRAFPVATRYVGRNPNARIEDEVRASLSMRSHAKAARSSSSCRGRAKSAASRRSSRRDSGRLTSTLRHSMARWIAARRISPSRRPPRGDAKSCSPPRSRRRPSPSKACASSSTAGSCAFQSMSPTSA